MGADGRIALRGDEGQLFVEYGDELDRIVTQLVRTSRANIEDACGFAWTQFVRHQPDRDHNWRAWLVQVARREAWRLAKLDRRSWTRVGAQEREVPDPGAEMEPRVELQEALEALNTLRPRLRRIAFLRAVGLSYDEIGRITGDSRTRVGQLVRRANEALWAAAQQRREFEAPAPPRVARLRSLEREPPSWLTKTLGRPPTGRDALVTHVLLWRRAALALDDYRRQRGTSVATALDAAPEDPRLASSHAAAWRAVERYRGAIGLRRERPTHARER